MSDSLMYSKAYAAQKGMADITSSAHAPDYFGAGAFAMRGINLAVKEKEMLLKESVKQGLGILAAPVAP